MSAITSWHRGEVSVRQKLGYDKIPQLRRLFDSIQGELPDQHSKFYTTRLHFLPITTLDEEGRPWGSIASGKGGEKGFVSPGQPKYNVLHFDIESWEGDPLLENLRDSNGNGLIAGIGVEVATRRRNKFAGHILKYSRENTSVSLDVEVNQAIGNCPKYIAVRDVSPTSSHSPTVVHSERHLSGDGTLPDEAIHLILQSDTTFLGTTYVAISEQDSTRNPSHVGMNHRGGRPGFIRVRNDKRTIVLPDFSGNRIMTSLGNVEATPLASLTFLSFTTGDILYVTGVASNHFNDDSRAIMPLQDSITQIYVTGFTYVRDALPVRQNPKINVEPSPYSPPIKYLAEELASTSSSSAPKILPATSQPTALLRSITMHSDDIASFRWELDKELDIQAGQVIVLDLSALLGQRRYQHMAQMRPSAVNDDFVRTWTVSGFVPSDSTPASGESSASATSTSATPSSSSTSPTSAHNPNSDIESPTVAKTKDITLTLRHKQGGAVTTALFSIARRMKEVTAEMMHDTRGMELRVKVVGVGGAFVLGDENHEGQEEIITSDSKPLVRHSLWVAGGIGITPFLAMLSSLQDHRLRNHKLMITFVLSTREPEVLIPLVEAAISSTSSSPSTISASTDSTINLTLHLFTTRPIPPSHNLNIIAHHGRITTDVLRGIVSQESIMDGGKVYICGPGDFQSRVVDMLGEVGIEKGRVVSEEFSY